MFRPKKWQFSQNPHYITVVRFKQKFVSLVNNLDYFSFIEVCPNEVNSVEIYPIDIYHVG
jgi:hypothetical protein